jgi:hypothetical protein
VQLFDRSCIIRFPGRIREISGVIGYQRDEGPRISFSFSRSIQAEPDQGTVRIYNLPEDLTRKLVAEHEMFQSNLRAIQGGVTVFDTREQLIPGTGFERPYKVNRPQEMRITDQERARRLHTLLEQHIVEVWAGFGADAQQIFRGDIIALRPRIRDGQDYICELDLGDGFVALQEQWMAGVYGVGDIPANLLASMMALTDAIGDDQKIKAAIGVVAPNALTAKLGVNEYVATGRPADMISDVADFLGLYWWVRDGRIEFIDRTSFLPDFAVVLDAQSTLIETGVTDDGAYRSFQCLLAPQVHPGRAIRIIDELGQVFNGRILSTKLEGDTHGEPWYITGLCDSSNWTALPFVEPGTGPRLQITEAEWSKQTDARTGGKSIPEALKIRPR